MNQNKITQKDIDHLTCMQNRFITMYFEHPSLDYMVRFMDIIKKLQSNLDSEKELNSATKEYIKSGGHKPRKLGKAIDKPSQLSRIEETVNYIKEALQPMESEIEFHIPKEGFIFNPKSVTEHELENNRKGDLQQQQQLSKGEIQLQELIEKWKAKESKPLLTDIFIQMLRDRHNGLISKLLDEKLLLSTDEMLEVQRIHQILKNL